MAVVVHFLHNVHRLDTSESSDVSTASENLTQHIKKYISDASLLRTHGQELIFTLPLASADKFAGKFPCQVFLGFICLVLLATGNAGIRRSILFKDEDVLQ